MGVATDSLVCEGCIVSGGRIDRTILGPSSRVNSYAHVEESILFDGVDVGRHARLRRVIVDKNVEIPPRTEIGYDLDADRKRYPVIDDIVVIPKSMRIPERPQVFVPGPLYEGQPDRA
jgi:glucose-1-phosphate adenylyltransferase